MALRLTMNDLAIFILAGGQSSRMGRDKALLAFEGIPLLQRALQTCAAISCDVWIVGQVSKYGKFGPTIEDIHRDCGPLGGIHAALQSSASAYNLILAVDMPFVSSALLRFLAERAARNEADVTVPEVENRLQPLCAIYRKSFWAIADKALKNTEYKITSLFSKVETQVVRETELAHAGFSADVFRNWNSPADIGADVSLGLTGKETL
jgi:molybdopterin-guanine dinucleotide biosynthesis protein A